MQDKAKIVKVKKNPHGEITDVMMEDGNVYSINDAIMMAKDNSIENVNVGRSKNGKEYLRSNPNGFTNDNLDNLSTF
ncbi:DUF3892 domain-containing protein [Anaeromicrobium sediminis]|uniref:DUF3892 domain-containing protein n=1 Tax=Anaeromicrobium sediminis TaxID=1478221 RepID=A0A267MPD7_9FIRM|nr:DUF3892 domain-containing protein [Anaeromicrobium sediminis]PAB61282.1 hypothetical protein CCE28_02300 [Anaeromicrobium sediminis]